MNSINHIIHNCAFLKKNEPALIICDNKTKKLSNEFLRNIKKITNKVNLINLGNLKFHGDKINKNVKKEMVKSKIIFCLTKYSLAHSSERIIASKRGARFLSLPDYSFKFIRNPAIKVNYKKISKNMKKFFNLFNKGKKILIKNENGTNLELKVSGRKANFCPGYVSKKGDLGSPPDIEVNISPLENQSTGIAIINGSVTHPKIKLLKKPIKLLIKKGKIHELNSDNKKYEKILKKIFGNRKSKKRILAECGIGFNPKAKLTGHMLTDEGSKGCIHLGFGANHTVGGKNKISYRSNNAKNINVCR